VRVSSVIVRRSMRRCWGDPDEYAGEPTVVAAGAPLDRAAQSYEKNQLGLGAVFLNSLRLTWSRSLLADAAVLLRARVILETPGPELPMFELTPSQLALDLEN